jgi:proline iminopeptidase
MRAKFIKEENLNFDFRDGLSALKCPVLLLAGEHDPVHPAACAEETSRYVPESLRFLKVLPAGAPVYIDDPSGFRSGVSEFVDKIFDLGQAFDCSTK